MLAPLALLVLAAPGERLDRGTVAVTGSEGVFVSWRLLPEDRKDAAFDVYRQDRRTGMRRITKAPIKAGTWYLDREGKGGESRYAVMSVGGHDKPTVVEASPQPYLSIPLRELPGYSANDGSVGDLDGDGQYEIVVHRTGRAKDNSQAGETDPPVLEAYRLNGAFLWRIDLGRNIREGAHYTQFLVYDFDGDGRAEIACRTSDGTRDGKGKVLGDPKADHRNETGYILNGPENLTVFDGLTGSELSTVPYVPSRHPTKADPTPDDVKAVWGDGYGNRVDRFLAGVAYLDGKQPSLVFSRGYYTRTVLAAWDFRGGRLVPRWTFDSDSGNLSYAGQGNHGFSVHDVDGDGRDEIVFGSMTVDDDGKGLYSTGLGHGDALHVSDLDPTRPGLEVFAIHEKSRTQTGVTFRDAATGKVLWSKSSPDVGRGVAFDIDPRHPGAESWAAMGEGLDALWNAKGEEIGQKRPKSCNFGVWWDGDPLREILDANVITKWDWNAQEEKELLRAVGCVSNNGTKSTPVLSGDLLGDWREEVVWRTDDDRELRIYTTTIPTPHRLPTLASDRAYRLALAWQNTGYNQPPHPSFDMATKVARPSGP
ncbi:MAG: rhamnogalacturonan lyase [Fimbriimonas sp.]